MKPIDSRWIAAGAMILMALVFTLGIGKSWGQSLTAEEPKPIKRHWSVMVTSAAISPIYQTDAITFSAGIAVFESNGKKYMIQGPIVCEEN